MTKVYQSTIIEAPIGRVWSVVRDFNALPDWHSLIANSHIEGGIPPDQVGCIRQFELQDGSMLREQLIALSDFDLSFGYTILESPMPLHNYIASMSLRPVTELDHTFIDWTAEFDCAPELERDLIQQIGEGVFATGFNSLKQKLGA